MATWYIASQNPGTSSFLDTDLVAVNFWVRAPVDGLDVAGIKAIAAGRHPEWDRKVPGIQTNFAGQLAQFASGMEIGDDVITFDAAARDVILTGKVRGAYQYEDPQTLPGHPHVRAVEWLGTTDRVRLPDRGAGIEHVRGITVRRLSDAVTAPVAALDDAPLPPAELRSPRPSVASASDEFAWEPASGMHRYVLNHSFRSAPAERPLLVVMLNPAANHVPGFRRSTTCHAVRRWAEAHGYDGAVYVNLFSYIEPNSAFLGRVPPHDLNGPDADRELERVAQGLDGVTIAGWGNLPPGFNRTHYDDRVARIEQLLGRPLFCLGFTRAGYPRHGRGWRVADKLVPLRSG